MSPEPIGASFAGDAETPDATRYYHCGVELSKQGRYQEALSFLGAALEANPAYAAELKRHRDILNSWIKETGDKGQTPESAVQLKATYDLWKDKAIFKNAKVNPEYDQFHK